MLVSSTALCTTVTFSAGIPYLVTMMFFVNWLTAMIWSDSSIPDFSISYTWLLTDSPVRSYSVACTWTIKGFPLILLAAMPAGKASQSWAWMMSWALFLAI